MARRYVHEPYRSARFDPSRCAAGMTDKFHSLQCARKPMPGSEWCHQHSPEQVERRRATQTKRWEEKQERRRQADIKEGLREATVEQLEAELARRRGKEGETT